MFKTKRGPDDTYGHCMVQGLITVGWWTRMKLSFKMNNPFPIAHIVFDLGGIPVEPSGTQDIPEWSANTETEAQLRTRWLSAPAMR